MLQVPRMILTREGLGTMIFPQKESTSKWRQFKIFISQGYKGRDETSQGFMSKTVSSEMFLSYISFRKQWSWQQKQIFCSKLSIRIEFVNDRPKIFSRHSQSVFVEVTMLSVVNLTLIILTCCSGLFSFPIFYKRVFFVERTGNLLHRKLCCARIDSHIDSESFK